MPQFRGAEFAKRRHGRGCGEFRWPVYDDSLIFSLLTVLTTNEPEESLSQAVQEESQRETEVHKATRTVQAKGGLTFIALSAVHLRWQGGRFRNIDRGGVP